MRNKDTGSSQVEESFLHIFLVVLVVMALVVVGVWQLTTGPQPLRTLAQGQFTIAIGDTVEKDTPAPGAGTIETPGEEDTYTFSATAGQYVYVNIPEREGMMASIPFRLLNSKGTELLGGALGTEANDPGRVFLAESGTYTIIVGNEDVEEAPDVGEYAFTLLDVPGDSEFTINIGTKVAGTLKTAGERDVYTFTAQPGQRIFLDIHTEKTSESLKWVRLELADEQTTVLGAYYLGGDETNPDDQDSKNAITLSVGGTYTILVGELDSDATGSYEFQIWDANAQEFAIAIGDTVTSDQPAPGAGRIETPGTQDAYVFAAAPGQTVGIQIVRYNGVDRVALKLLDAQGTQLVETTLRGKDISQKLDRGGRYTILVGSDDYPDTGTYEFTLTGDTPYTMQGVILDQNNQPVEGVTITRGEVYGDTTDSDGEYVAAALEAGQYTLTPTKEGCDFSPASIDVSVPPNQSDHNFRATCSSETYSISGRIVDADGGAAVGVLVSAGTTFTSTTSINGGYLIDGLSEGTYTVTPSRDNCEFSPASIRVSVPPDEKGHDFEMSCTAQTYSISGKVVDAEGKAVVGVALSVGDDQSTTNGEDGTYTLGGLLGGRYTITPSKQGCSFAPASLTVTLPPAAADQDFTATCQPTPTPTSPPTDTPAPTATPAEGETPEPTPTTDGGGDDPYPGPGGGDEVALLPVIKKSGSTSPPQPTAQPNPTPGKPTAVPTPAAPPGSPARPSGLKLKALSATSIRVTWQDNSDDEWGFAVDDHRPHSKQPIVYLVANTTSYTAKKLTPNTRYCFAVSSFNGFGYSNWTAWACKRTLKK